MTVVMIFGLMLIVVMACTFFFLVGRRKIDDQATSAISEICEQSRTLEQQIMILATNVKALCEEVNLLKQENQTLQEQIAALASDVKHISNKCVVMSN